VCYARIDSEGTRYLLGDMAGHLFMLLLNYEKNPDGTFKIKDPKVDLLGKLFNNNIYYSLNFNKFLTHVF
jgi:DNA damage-binding protein 1